MTAGRPRGEPCRCRGGGLSPALQRKSPPEGGLCFLLDPGSPYAAASRMTFRQKRAPCARLRTSLDLAFLVDHVLADDGVVFLDLHLVRGVLLVLVGGVEVARAGRGNQADLVAFGCHGSSP